MYFAKYGEADVITKNSEPFGMTKVQYVWFNEIKIYAEPEYNEIHVKYNEARQYTLAALGYRVKERILELDIDHDQFNELDFQHYRMWDTSLVLFSNLAIKLDSVRLDYFCKEGIQVDDCFEHWQLDQEKLDMTLEMEISIPQDEYGQCAKWVEGLAYDLRDWQSGPGERQQTEERFDNLKMYYRDLVDGESLTQLFDEMKIAIGEVMMELEDQKKYTKGPARKRCKNEIIEGEKLLDRINFLKERLEFLHLNQAPNTQSMGM